MRMRHYCDHCKKSTGTKPAMVKHESRCTANPDRVCGLCKVMDEVQLPMAELLEAHSKGFDALIKASHGCPACILAAERQFNPERDPDLYYGWDHPTNTERGEWNFKAAMKEFWVTHKERHPQDDD
jgi:hypothetical protein